MLSIFLWGTVVLPSLVNKNLVYSSVPQSIINYQRENGRRSDILCSHLDPGLDKRFALGHVAQSNVDSTGNLPMEKECRHSRQSENAVRRRVQGIIR
jgi:hypothetical protein